jgi:hypothetical protein
MLKRFILMITICTVSSFLWADLYQTPVLTRIINQWEGGPVTVQNTDDNAGNVVVNGDRKVNSQDAFNVNEISSINYRIPEASDGQTRGGWGNLYIRVYKNGNDDPIAVGELQANWANNTNSIELIPRSMGKNVQAKKVPYVYAVDVNYNQFTVLIDKNGVISIPHLITIRVNNGTQALLELNSPDCSLEKADTMITRIGIDPSERRDMTIIFNPKAKCKIVATTVSESGWKLPIGTQATMCISENWDKTDHGCPGCSLESNSDYICCDEDPFTGENVCGRKDITWVRGHTKNLTAVHTFIEYGITVTEAYKKSLAATAPVAKPAVFETKPTPGPAWSLPVKKRPTIGL